MIDAIIASGIEPFTTNLGWQAFSYGVVGRIVATYAKNFVNEISSTADDVSNATEEDLNDDSK